MFGLLRKQTPQEYPTLDQICAYFYVVANTGSIFVESAESGPSMEKLYNNHAILDSSVNLEKTTKRSDSTKIDESEIIGIDFGSACEEAVDWIKPFNALEVTVEQMSTPQRLINEDLELNRKLAAALVREIGGESHDYSSPENSVITDLDVDYLDISGVRVPDFSLVKTEELSPDEISQMLQAFYAGFALRIRNKLETLDAVKNAKRNSKSIARQVGGGVSNLKYSPLEKGKTTGLLLENQER